MRKIFWVLSVWAIMGVSCATSGTKVTEPVAYSETVDVAGVSQDDLYIRANMWFVDAFNKADSVIQFSDKENGVIKGKYIGDNVTAGMYICKISATVSVEVKDGRYRITFDNPQYQYVGDVLSGIYAQPGVSGTVENVEMAEKIKPEWIKLAESLKSSVQTEKSDW
jgi:hypothetical protein